MSLQVQSSQQPPASSGRRTPQIYQSNNRASPVGSTTSSSTNGNNKSTAKLSLKAVTSGKQSPVVVSETTPAAIVKEGATVSEPVNKNTSSPKAPADKEKEKAVVAATNGSTNGNHSDKKETNGKHAEEPATASPRKEEDKEKKVKEGSKASPRVTPQKAQPAESIPVEQIKTPESSGKKLKESPLATPEQKKKVENSLVAEKTLKGFTAEGDEMESLVVEPSEYEDSPMPPRTGGKTKLLKYAVGPPTRARISPCRINEASGNANVMANLSTVSEGQTSAPESNEASPTVDFNRPLRSISGRRATRPINDIQFSYRKSTELNDSVSSLNVTVGSEIHNDSLRTPAPGSSRKRKATPESTSDALDVKEIIDSPKRGRLDFSGFLGMVSTPVTMLKNRLSRVKLQSSTPVAKRILDEEDLTKCVTAEATTTTANISGDSATMEVESEADKTVEEVEKTEQKTTEGQTELPEAAEEAKESESGDTSETVEVKDVTHKQRQFCVVM